MAKKTLIKAKNHIFLCNCSYRLTYSAELKPLFISQNVSSLISAKNSHKMIDADVK